MNSNNTTKGRKRTDIANTYKCRMVAKNFPLFQKGVLDKITVRNGFTLAEVREYKSKLRAIALDSIGKNKIACAFEDKTNIGAAFLWNCTLEGDKYWYLLGLRLNKVANIPTLSPPLPASIPSSPSTPSYSVQGKDKAL